MTLIIASVRQHDLVLTSDGRSTTMRNGKVAGVDDRYQKLFPIPDHPVVTKNRRGGSKSSGK
jgi:hypothetical protein